MRYKPVWNLSLGLLVWGGLACSWSWAQPAPTPPTNPPPAAPQTQPAPSPLAAPPQTEGFGQAPSAEGEAPLAMSPNMIGDFLDPVGASGSSLSNGIPAGPAGSTFLGISPGTGGGPSFAIFRLSNGSLMFLPIGSTSSSSSSARAPSETHEFKIAVNNNPLPEDRLYTTFNYYNQAGRGLNKALGVSSPDVFQYTTGLEKSFLDGWASLGLQAPLNQIDGAGTNAFDYGNLSIFGKFVLWRDDASGSGLSTGLAVTAPTGPKNFANLRTGGAPFNDTMLQPFVGAYLRGGDAYLIAFSSLDIPTDSRDVLLLYNDVGLGYYLWNDTSGESLVSGIAPTVEVHVNTPLNHAGLASGPLGTPNWVSLTSGVILEFNQRASLSLGFNLPVTGPLPYVAEGIAQFNLRF